MKSLPAPENRNGRAYATGSNGGRGNGASPVRTKKKTSRWEWTKVQAFTEGKRHTLGSDHSGSRTLYSLIMLYNIRYNEMID